MDEKVPAGFRFNPFEEELVTNYLKPKVLGRKLPTNVVEERQLYGPNADPWQVFDPENHSWILSEVSPGKFEKITYVFVNLTKKGAAGKKKKVSKDNYVKKAGCGTWDGQTKRYEIRDCNGVLIGEKRFLVFEINDDSDQDLSKVGYWKMHEYHLRGINEDISNPCNTVLCKITFDCSKNPPVKLRPKINDDHPGKSSSKPQKKNTNVDRTSPPSTMNSGPVDSNQGVSENYEEAIANQTRGDDLVVSDSYRDTEKERYSGPEIVEICDQVECVKISDVEENTPVTACSPAEQLLDTGCPKPVSSDFCWPAIYNNGYAKIKEEGGRRKLNIRKNKVHFSSCQKPNKEQSIEDTSTVLGKRKSVVETLRAITKKLNSASSEFCCPAKHDSDYQKAEEEAGRREEMISNFIKFL
ncbi:hypothetical protein POM88_009441 [Heracleum sosnowskyi]|uniref:NAC domain-containing protein n=1 Tax=Heracleum sosnowskyi TaxID=360622 RepID=A0AAD8J952_9APIA|nr:hypothetical protein POM88_009441 [Heracleum sosnowskyi]